LQDQGYAARANSLAFPDLKAELINQLLRNSQSMKRTAWLKQLRQQLRALNG